MGTTPASEGLGAEEERCVGFSVVMGRGPLIFRRALYRDWEGHMWDQAENLVGVDAGYLRGNV